MVGKISTALAAAVVAIATVALVTAPAGAAPSSAHQAAPPPDLWLSWNPPAQVDVGSTVPFHVDVTNRGGPATDAVVVVELGPELELVSAAVGWVQRPCAIDGSTATCTVGAMTDYRFVKFTAQAVAEGPASIDVVASSDDVDANPADNALSTSVYVRGPSAVDLRLTGEVAPATVAPTEQLSYRLRVTNLFPHPSNGVRVTSTVPDAFEVRATSIGYTRSCAVAGQEVTCDVGTLAASGLVDVTIVLAALDVPGSVELSAEVDATTPDPFPADDTTTSTATIDGVAEPPDLVVALALPATSSSGAPLQGWLSVTNRGGPATGVVAELEVPAGSGLVSATTGLHGRSCAIDGTTVTCAMSSSPFLWYVDLQFAPSDGTHELAASVRADQPDGDPSSNATSASVVVGGPTPVDLRLQSSLSTHLARPGDAVTHQLDITNASAGPASGVVVTTVVPDAFEVRSAAIGWLSRPCTVVGQDVSCLVGALPAGDARFVLLGLVVAEATPSGEVQLTARVDGSVADPIPADNADGSTLTVDASGALPDLRAQASLPATSTVGTPVPLFVAATYTGGPATSVVATVQLPVGLEVVSTSTGFFGKPCAVAGSTVTCSFAPSSMAWFASVVVRPTAPGTHQVQLDVSADETDADPSDNTTFASTTAT